MIGPDFDPTDKWKYYDQNQVNYGADLREKTCRMLPEIFFRIFDPSMDLKKIHDNNVQKALQENFIELV